METLSFTLAFCLGLIPHLISSILSFIFFLLAISFWLFAIDSDFFALIFILIYIGAIAVLFIFVTMLLHFFEHLEGNVDDDLDATGDYHPTTGNLQENGLGNLTLSELSILFTDLFEDDFDIFNDCLSSIEAIGAFDTVYYVSHIYLLSSALFTVFFPALLITVIILLITTIGIFFILYQTT